MPAIFLWLLCVFALFPQTGHAHQQANEIKGDARGTLVEAVVVDAGISTSRGNYADASFNLAAALPGIGQAATGAKLAAASIGAVGAGAKIHRGSRAVNKLNDTNTIRFTQKTAGRNIDGISSFGDGRPIQGLIDDLSSGAVSSLDIKPIRVFQRDGLTFTLDNRRLLAAQQAGVKVNTVPATAAEVANEAFKFTTKTQGQFIGVKGALK